MSLLQEAIIRIEALMREARESDLREPMAMSVATTDGQGRPSVRTVLLKQLDEQGLVFFTNTRSRKGQHIEAMPYAAICIYNQQAHLQVQVEGHVSMVSPAEADRYWGTRPRASQIGAWASRQSEPLASRQLLDERVARYEDEFLDKDVARPEFWNGYRVIPERIEFWRGHPDRLNERQEYRLTEDGWIKGELFP